MSSRPSSSSRRTAVRGPSRGSTRSSTGSGSGSGSGSRMTRATYPPGAGVLLLERYGARGGRPATAVILFRDERSGECSDAGGGMDPNEDALTCAQRELKEESAGLFRVDLAAAVKRPVRLRNYTAFVVPVRGPPSAGAGTGTGGIQSARFRHNRAVLAGMGLPRSSVWRETDLMTRFYVQDVAAAISAAPPQTGRGGLKAVVRDVYGARHVVSARTTGLLRRALADDALRWGAYPAPNQLRETAPYGVCRKAVGPGSSGMPPPRGQTTFCYWT